MYQSQGHTLDSRPVPHGNWFRVHLGGQGPETEHPCMADLITSCMWWPSERTMCRAREGGPHDAGHYNSRFWETDFFSDCGRWRSPYGEFFLRWYSQALLDYADKFLGAVGPVLHSKCTSIILDSVDEVCGEPSVSGVAWRDGVCAAEVGQPPVTAAVFGTSQCSLGGAGCGARQCARQRVRTACGSACV
jgi:Glycosyl hydrolase family 14